MSLYSRGNARKSLIDTVAFRAISQVATVLGYVILVRGMTEGEFGVYSLLYAFIPVVSTVASLGLEQVLRRYQPEYMRTGNKAAAAWLVRVVSAARLLTNIIVLSIILLAWKHIAPVFKLAEYRFEFIAFSFLILLHFQFSILQMALGSHMLHRYSVGATAIMSVVKLAVYAVLSGMDVLTLEAAIFADTGACFISYVVMQVAYRKLCLGDDAKVAYKPDAAERKRLGKYALFNNFNDAGVLLMYSTLDNFFLAAFISTVAVGIYAFYTRLRMMVQNVLPMQLFGNVIQPMFFSVPVEESSRKIPNYFSFLMNMSLLVQWPILAYVTAYHAAIVQVVFDGKFIDYSWLLPMVMAFGVINTVAEPATLVAQYLEKPEVILKSKLFAIYNIAAMAALVPLLGVYGAALAAGTAQTMKNAYIWWHVRNRAIWTNARPAMLVGVTWWGLSALVCMGVMTLLDVPALIHLAIGMLIMALAGLAFLRSAAISATDRAILAAVTPDKMQGMLRMTGLLPPAASLRTAGTAGDKAQ